MTDKKEGFPPLLKIEKSEPIDGAIVFSEEMYNTEIMLVDPELGRGILDIPQDVTSYESAKLAQLALLLRFGCFFDCVRFVREEGLIRLFKFEETENAASTDFVAQSASVKIDGESGKVLDRQGFDDVKVTKTGVGCYSVDYTGSDTEMDNPINVKL